MKIYHQIVRIDTVEDTLENKFEIHNRLDRDQLSKLSRDELLALLVQLVSITTDVSKEMNKK